jgi:WD40 repeat protein
MPFCPLQQVSEASVFPGIPRLVNARASSWPVLAQVLMSHTKGVNSVAFSPEGRRVISGSSDRKIRIWNAFNGREMAVLEGHTGSVQSVAFSPDGRYIASGSRDGSVRIWDADDGLEVTVIRDQGPGWVFSVAFSPDGQCVIFGCSHRTLGFSMLNMNTVCQTVELEGHSKGVTAVAFCRSGQRVLSGSLDKTVRLWDSRTYKQMVVWEGHTDYVRSVAFSPDGELAVSGSDDRTVCVWNVLTGSRISTLTGHSDCVRTVAFAPDGKRVLSGSRDRTVRIWPNIRASAGKELILLEGRESHVNSAVFSSHGQRVVTGSEDGAVRIWNPLSSCSSELVTEPVVGNPAIRAVAISADGTRAASAHPHDHALYLWDLVSSDSPEPGETPNSTLFRVLNPLHVPQELHNEPDVTPVWPRKLGGHTASVVSLAFSPDARHLVSGSWDKSVRIWDALLGKPLAQLKGHSDFVHFVSFSPSAEHVLSLSYDATARVWDVATATQVAMLDPINDIVSHALWLNDSPVYLRRHGKWQWRDETKVTDGRGALGVDADDVAGVLRADSLTWEVKSGWVLLNTHYGASTTRLCWLPPSRRGSLYAACGHAIIIGTKAGVITILDFSATLKLLKEVGALD